MLTRSEVELQPLNWLTVLHIALYWLPALAPNPQYSPALAPYSPTQAPNNSVLHYKGYKRDNQIGSRITTPELAHSPTYSPVLAPYTGSHNSVLHLQIVSRIIVKGHMLVSCFQYKPYTDSLLNR